VSEGQVDQATADDFIAFLEANEKSSYEAYTKFAEKGIGRELARIALPVNIYTEWYWKCDLHNILHFLGLRMHEHAQKEIREFATAMFELVKWIVPIAAQAFLDYHHHMGGMALSRLEIEAIQKMGIVGHETGQVMCVPVIASTNKRERQEAYAKFEKMCLPYDTDPSDKKEKP
jgi:thymidylate synthase (FAD)